MLVLLCVTVSVDGVVCRCWWWCCLTVLMVLCVSVGGVV